tara:strand:+ start:2184 stop:3137 length:954 start_codon:yes stop_codon:yes gene_type:complete
MEKNNNFRCCKIVATYFGIRRFYPSNVDDTIEMLNDFVNHEKTINPGIKNLDVIFVNHDCGETKGKEFLNNLDGEKIYNGTIKVVHRPWDTGKGACLGSFDYGFKLFKNNYDYWFLQEDDYKIVHPQYYLNGINILEEDRKTAFVGYDMYFWEGIGEMENNQTPEEIFYKGKKNRQTLMMQLNIIKIIFTIPIIIFGYWKYLKPFLRTLKKTKLLVKEGRIPFCSGMMGLTKTKFLNEVVEKYGKLPYPNIDYNKTQKPYQKRNKLGKFRQNLKFSLFCVLGEMEFTRVYNDLGYNIRCYNNLKELIFSYKKNKFKK